MNPSNGPSGIMLLRISGALGRFSFLPHDLLDLKDLTKETDDRVIGLGTDESQHVPLLGNHRQPAVNPDLDLRLVKLAGSRQWHEGISFTMKKLCDRIIL